MMCPASIFSQQANDVFLNHHPVTHVRHRGHLKKIVALEIYTVLPSGNLTVCYWKNDHFFRWFTLLKMVMASMANGSGKPEWPVTIPDMTLILWPKKMGRSHCGWTRHPALVEDNSYDPSNWWFFEGAWWMRLALPHYLDYINYIYIWSCGLWILSISYYR